MIKVIIFLAVISAIGFASWPLIIRTFEVHPSWLVLILGIGAIIGGMAAITITRAPAPNTKAFLICSVGGIISGVGTYAYCKLVTIPSTKLSVAVPMMVLLIVVFAVLGAAIFYKEPITLKQWFALGLSGVSIWLLS